MVMRRFARAELEGVMVDGVGSLGSIWHHGRPWEVAISARLLARLRLPLHVTDDSLASANSNTNGGIERA